MSQRRKEKKWTGSKEKRRRESREIDRRKRLDKGTINLAMAADKAHNTEAKVKEWVSQDRATNLIKASTDKQSVMS